ncbi:twin-arginine translocation signal domain-containing protein [Novosphingobium sp. B 225]|uniref:twin-arginine translocation signal domain-containing protein n=1 Tax=Novosphingobium sp. B 225 TaxID=1961849 RepID=UPI000B4BA789|nr:twin-arginine translocation signal domain-containing protein [Novosphingobium sp. B 225]
MSAVTRRGLLKAGAVAGAAVAVPAGAMAFKTGALVVHDSREPHSLAFARMTGGTGIDLAVEHAQRFAGLRAGLPKGRGIEGLTRWSDYVALRRELFRQGFRVTAEARSGALIRWSMAAPR